MDNNISYFILCVSCRSLFYGWNWMGTSTKFINEVTIRSDSQKQLIELLKLYIDGVKEENFGLNLSKDFDISTELIRAKRRVETEQSKQIRNQASEHSLFLSLFPVTHLLIGDKYSSFYEMNKKICQSGPSSLHEISCEFELPLDYLITPIDFQETITFLLNGGNYEKNNLYISFDVCNYIVWLPNYDLYCGICGERRSGFHSGNSCG